MCRAIGTILIRQQIDGAIKNLDVIDFNRGCLTAFKRYFDDFSLGVDEVARVELLMWQNDPVVQQVLQNIITVSNFYKGTVLNQTEDEWFDNVTAAMRTLDVMSENLLKDLHDSPDLYNAVVSEAVKLGVTLFVSIVGILFISRAQNKASAKVEFALDRTRQMSRAVQAFIPRNFLKLMAVDSILHLERGDQTEVSVAMLLCDIRNFTGISEHMTNEQLFDWLQAHLTRMTRTTEKHNGFVDKFVGDAVSAIFMNPSDAVHCGVKMQTVTDALCYELIAHNEDHMVKIGVGVHYALVGVGVLGNDKHHSCSIVSAEINVAGQLEALTKQYGARIIITDRAAELLSEGAFEFRVLGRARLSLTSEREFTLYDIFQADPLPMKRYKHETAEVWDRLVQAQEDGRYADMKPLLAELEAAAKRHGVKDTALKTKAEAKNPFDQFDMESQGRPTA
jgi:class 3 adenylate cyclase